MTDPKTQTGMPTPSQMQGGKEVYDSLMKDIEPDLTTAVIDTLDAKYAGESEAEGKKRLERYATAFAEYQKRYKEFRNQKQSEIRSFGKGVITAIENGSAQRDKNLLTELEIEISHMQ